QDELLWATVLCSSFRHSARVGGLQYAAGTLRVLTLSGATLELGPAGTGLEGDWEDALLSFED
ncbi:MAG TPA: hypothetical protein VIW29_22635, partial [Polyangiaceae bacterium]